MSENIQPLVASVLSSMNEAIVAVDAHYKVTLINKATLEMFGMHEDDVLSRDYREVFKAYRGNELLKQDTSITKTIEERVKIKTSLEDNLFYESITGVKKPVAVSTAPIIENGVFAGAVVVFRDIKNDLDFNEQKSSFLSVAAHQLRTPLGSNKWTLEILLANERGALSNEVREDIQSVYDNNNRMLELVTELLNTSRIERGKIQNSPVSVEVCKEIAQELAALKPEIERKRITVDFVHTDFSPVITIDRQHFNDIMQNLLSNAIKYNKPEGRVTITVEPEDRNVKITVTDTGIGVADGDKSRIFSKFFRGGNAIRSESVGTGLGLYVVKSYIELAGGKIKFESKEKEGSTFVILLPTA